ncbi:MAG TPA: hypothetical protein PK941_13530 [Paludibacter sp.]|nr:hypothetical protein [Paludibacter sp.]
MKKVLVSLLLFGFLLLILTVSCTTKYLTKDQLPQDKITFLDEKDQFEITFEFDNVDLHQHITLLPKDQAKWPGTSLKNVYVDELLSGKKGLVIGTILGPSHGCEGCEDNKLYVIEIKDATITDYKYVFSDKWCVDTSKTAANERDKKIEQEKAKAKELGYPSVEAYNEAVAKAAEEKRKRELYSKPHHWLICESTGYSQVPPSLTQAMLKKFKLEAFDDGGKCADTAWYKNQMANQMGILCSCVYMKLDRKKAAARAGEDRMP